MRLTRELIYGLDKGASERVFREYAKRLDMSRTPTLREVPLEFLTQTVGVDDDLVRAKLVDDVIRGAEEDENLWMAMCKVVDMTDPQTRQPLITPDDFKLSPWTQGTRPRSSGGSFFGFEFDCRMDKGLYAFEVGLTSNQIRDAGYDALEEALVAAGQAVGRHLVKAIAVKYIADVDTDMSKALATWDPRASGDDVYGAMVGMEAGLANLGFNADLILVNPTEGADCAVLDTFIRDDYRYVAKGIPEGIHSIGALYGRIPIVRHRDITATNVIMAETRKAMALGIMEGGPKIENFKSIEDGMQGAVVSVQYELKSGKNAAGPKGATKPTDMAWAVCTGA
jgi:hypothetical protein